MEGEKKIFFSFHWACMRVRAKLTFVSFFLLNLSTLKKGEYAAKCAAKSAKGKVRPLFLSNSGGNSGGNAAVAINSPQLPLHCTLLPFATGFPTYQSI